ncbi:MAG: hypothetical protein DRJ26_03360, partial [Candidatus Methanomethylicota archaeon]
MGERAISLIDDVDSVEESSIIASSVKTSCVFASFINSVLVNALDYDDTSQADHPGATIIPAALAVAEKIGSISGKELITAIILGYEICEKIGRAIQPSWIRYIKVHGMSHQTFGAVGAASKLLKFDKWKFLNAIGLAGAFSPVPHAGKFGLDERPVVWIKNNVAWTSLAGVFAALLAEKGFIGSRSILDGDTGFWIMASSDKCGFDEMVKFEAYEILSVSFKTYPCCRWLHTTLDALRDIILHENISVDDVKKVNVRTIAPLVEKFMDYDSRNMIDAQFSLPYAVAMILCRIPRLKWYSKEILFNDKIKNVMRLVKAEVDEDAN